MLIEDVCTNGRVKSIVFHKAVESVEREAASDIRTSFKKMCTYPFLFWKQREGITWQCTSETAEPVKLLPKYQIFEMERKYKINTKHWKNKLCDNQPCWETATLHHIFLADESLLITIQLSTINWKHTNTNTKIMRMGQENINKSVSTNQHEWLIRSITRYQRETTDEEWAKLVRRIISH